MMKPPALKSGDIVRVIAPSSPFDKDGFAKGVAVLKSWGLRVKYRRDIFARHPQHDYLAGTDVRRCKEWREALFDPATKAVFCARGGYGAARLITAIAGLKPPRQPKILIGFSDATVLFHYVTKSWRWPVLYGPVVGGTMGQLSDPFTAKWLRRILFNAEPLGVTHWSSLAVIRPGVAHGVLAGGCLSLIDGSIGTPYEIDTRRKILFFEDVHEKPYQIDRMLTHLKLAGKFKDCRGVIVGHLTGSAPVSRYENTVADIFRDAHFPVLMRFPTGHQTKMFTLPLGVRVALDSRRKTVDFAQSPVAGTGKVTPPSPRARR